MRRDPAAPMGLLERLRLGARRVVRRLAERALRRTYDGASPPPRLVDEVRAFRVLHPGATADDWEDFALGLAASAWRDAFAYGVEWRERYGERVAWDEALLPPEEARARLWTQPVEEDPGDPLAGVPEERREEVLREIEFGLQYGGVAFRWVDGDGRPIFPPVTETRVSVGEEEEGDDGDEDTPERGDQPADAG